MHRAPDFISIPHTKCWYMSVIFTLEEVEARELLVTLNCVESYSEAAFFTQDPVSGGR